MTREEKQLLLKDLCARLPHGVKIWIKWDKNPSPLTTSILGNYWHTVGDDIKPYLRPLSSMTEKEKIEFSVFIGKTERYVQEVCLDADSMINPIIGGYKCIYWGLFDKCIDWLNAHHFDYRGLIPMGLALEAPEDVYKTK